MNRQRHHPKIWKRSSKKKKFGSLENCSNGSFFTVVYQRTVCIQQFIRFVPGSTISTTFCVFLLLFFAFRCLFVKIHSMYLRYNSSFDIWISIVVELAFYVCLMYVYGFFFEDIDRIFINICNGNGNKNVFIKIFRCACGIECIVTCSARSLFGGFTV